jgi:N-acetylmuramoyl-L-alanine amidase
VTLIHEYLPLCKCRPGTKRAATESITIHWIGDYPEQSVHDPRNWWLNSGGDSSAHFIIKDDLVLTAIPIDEVAYHCGVPLGNDTSIGIEVIPADHTGVFSAASIQTLKTLLSNLPRVPLKRHFDWSKKDCPLFYTPLVPDGEEHWKTLVKELNCETF